jgi:hypothetical protein
MAKKIILKVLPKTKVDPSKWSNELKEQVREYGDTQARLSTRIKKVMKEVQPALKKGAKLKIYADPDKHVIGYEFFSPPGKNVKVLLTKIKLEGTKIKAFLPCQGAEGDVEIEDDDLDENIPPGAEEHEGDEEDEEQQQEDTTSQTPSVSPQTQPPKVNSLVWQQRLAVVSPKLKTALASGHKDGPSFTKMFNDANTLAKEKKYAEAVALLGKLEPLLDAGGAGGGAQMGKWVIAKNGSIKMVRSLQTALGKKAQEPDLDDALKHGALEVVKRLDAIPTELSKAKLSSLQEISALENYIKTDETITKAEMPNPFNLNISIRDPLLQALEEAKKNVPS